jgi:DNA polymerase-1
MIDDYQIYIGFEHLEKVQTAISLAFDVETLQLRPEYGKMRLLQLASHVRKIVVVIDIFECDEAQLEKLKHFFNGPTRFWLAHNAAFDLGWLQAYGWYPEGEVRDTMLASQLLNNGLPNLKHNLAAVAKRYLKIELDKTQQTSNWGAELTTEQIEYAAKDVAVLCELDDLLHRKIADDGLGLAYSLECRALPAMAQMSRVGLPWDGAALRKVEEDYAKDVENLGREVLLELDAALPEGEKLPRHDDGTINTNTKTSGSVKLGTKKYAGFNIASPTQLVNVLTLILGKAPIDPKTNRPSASRQALREYAADSTAIQTYLEWKKAEKRRQMVHSLLEKLDDDGFIRAGYMQVGAATGRMTCFHPNLQQIPRDEQFRAAVVAPEGWVLVNADFSQMELRLLARIAEDENMANAFKDGEDLHTVTAEALGCTRQISKSANFGLAYGSGAKGLRQYAAGMGVTLSLQEATGVRAAWLEKYDGVKKWHRRLAKLSDQTEGQMAEIRIPVTRMRRYLPADMNKLTIRANSPVQGAGAAILKCALGNLWKDLKGSEEAKLCGAVHDELLVLVRKGHEDRWAHLVKQAMERAEAKWLGDIPAVADVNVGTSWAETH